MASVGIGDESLALRERCVDVQNKRLLIAKILGTQQEKDLTVPPNCAGLGRIRHFHRKIADSWPTDPLPLDPACRALGLSPVEMLRTQVFQLAACSWRCWYCFVPFELISADAQWGEWHTSESLLDLFESEANHPFVIDLSGGHPDIAPEWVPWMMSALRSRGLGETVYLWSDDNLSNDFFWRFLSDKDRESVVAYRNYGRVCCFKGFSAESFSFNTGAPSESFANQFELMRRLLTTGIDVYGYVTFTTPCRGTVQEDMRRFVDALQTLHYYLPLRVVPLLIRVFSPVRGRLNDAHRDAMQFQYVAAEAWTNELTERYSSDERSLCIAEVPLRRQG